MSSLGCTRTRYRRSSHLSVRLEFKAKIKRRCCLFLPLCVAFDGNSIVVSVCCVSRSLCMLCGQLSAFSYILFALDSAHQLTVICYQLDAGLSFELVHDATRVSDKKKIANEICAAARRHGADFIVTGNRGCSGVKKVPW